MPASERGDGAADVAVVVVNYDAGPLLARCLASVLAQRPPPREVLVVDNASRDGSADGLPAGVGLLRRADNAGFARAAQDGIDATSAPLVLLLNPDTVLTDDCLARAAVALRADETLGAVAPRVLQSRAPERIDATGIGLTSFLGQINWDHDRPLAALDERPHEVLGPLGGASLWRRDALRSVGGFCGDYFLYWEDMDLALRLLRAGWRCRTVPAARVLHDGGATVGHRSARNVFYMVRNHAPCLLAALPGPTLRRRWPAWLVAPLRAAVLYARGGRPLAALAGLCASLPLLPGAMRRRRAAAGHAAPDADARAAERLETLMRAADENRRQMKRAAAARRAAR